MSTTEPVLNTTLPPAQAQLSPAVQSASGNSPNMFPNAAGFEIVGGTFVSGNMHIHHPNPGPGPTSSLPLNTMDDTFSESEIYCNQLLRRKRGFPLYVPGPQQNLPADYQNKGVAIGDVGRVTPDGIFDFFFNIYLPADHPVNDNDVPENFYPLPPYSSKDVFYLNYDAGTYVSTSSVEKLYFDPNNDFVFSCGPPEGAVLALPHGAHAEKLENLETVREHVATHAEKWYKYINSTRGRGLANGSLYLVTGWEKAKSWGMASFHGVGGEFQLAFQPTIATNSTFQYRWSGVHGCRNPAQTKSYYPSSISNRPLNQTTFIHGLSISLGTGIWGKLFASVEIREIVESRLGSPNGNLTSYPRGSSLFSWSLGFLGGVETTGGKQHAQQVTLSDISPISKMFHPGKVINDYILQKAPQATVVMSHDDDWGDILADIQDPKSKMFRNCSNE
ncbi:hypothetical protein B0H19DRAFT_91533 [Mycena capillaripes]|nr:hypothetical protein B0H19DRAFT_91533 [Mycena capillaripes]